MACCGRSFFTGSYQTFGDSIMSDYIKVIMKDGSFWESNGVISVIWAADELIILFSGLFGMKDSKIIDGTMIKSFWMKRGE